MSVEKVKLDEIARDDSTQARANGTEEHIVAEYAQAMESGATFPAVQLYSDGETYYIADGFHRVEAARQAGLDRIQAEVREGTQRDARLAALSANENHGLRRTNQDRRNAVIEALQDPEWARWSNRKVAEVCNVSHTFVANIRKELAGERSRNTAGSRGGNVASEKPSGNVASSTEDKMLWSVSDDALIRECQRRGMEVQA